MSLPGISALTPFLNGGYAFLTVPYFARLFYAGSTEGPKERGHTFVAPERSKELVGGDVDQVLTDAYARRKEGIQGFRLVEADIIGITSRQRLGRTDYDILIVVVVGAVIFYFFLRR